MDFDMYPSISGKQQDPVREVVMKYIDYFLPDASGTSAVAIDNKIEQAMVSPLPIQFLIVFTSELY
ncbi:GL18767 [Drosophila persimilis]|uniref:GL18767 n=1 Tax=Drosophila persimilis TaxID=7234 RepID=B4G8U0_DROPE|nr:GL18767 [Drosophila persimilis]